MLEQNPDLVLLFGGAIVVVAYILSLYLHPYTQCGRCKGTSIHKGAVFGGAHRRCHKCSGTGRRQRLGAMVLKIGDPRRSTSRFHPRHR